ncbi:hypothetical protein [Aureimonas sp. Leaf324]|uniref:hypothetical protein n=1 Tax=Aureimonas sp. Leaf324 TaxID=1736336 RepID=UPI000AF0FA01|nr:hypothetical protein [Aureimonas sp. Leaf324]
MTRIDPDAYIRTGLEAGQSLKRIASEIGCTRMDVYQRVKAMGVRGPRPPRPVSNEKAIDDLVAEIGRPGNALHALVVRIVAETVLAAKCRSEDETERMAFAVSSALNRVLRHDDVKLTWKDRP